MTPDQATRVTLTHSKPRGWYEKLYSVAALLAYPMLTRLPSNEESNAYPGILS